MATLTAQQITQAGLVPATVTPAVAGDKLANTAKQFFHVENGGAVSITATVIPVVTTVVDPLQVDAFNDVDGNITITCSATASIKLSALYL